MKTNAHKGAFRYTADEKAEALRLYAAGLPSGEVAARVGCSQTMVVRWARAAKLKIHRPSPPTKVLPSAGDLWREYAELGSWQRVANKHGVALTTVLNRKEVRTLPSSPAPAEASP